MLGRDETENELGEKRFITLNLCPMENMKGGEEGEEKNRL